MKHKELHMKLLIVFLDMKCILPLQSQQVSPLKSHTLCNGTSRRRKQNYQASIMPVSVLPLTPMTIMEV